MCCNTYTSGQRVVPKRLLFRRPSDGEQIDERAQLARRHVRKLPAMCVGDWQIELGEERQAIFGDPRRHHAPIRVIALSPHQSTLDQTVDESCDVRNLRDEARTDVVSAEALGPCSTQNSKHVVLCRCDAVLLEGVREPVQENGSRSLDAEQRFLLETVEWFALPDLGLQGGHTRLYVS